MPHHNTISLQKQSQPAAQEGCTALKTVRVASLSSTAVPESIFPTPSARCQTERKRENKSTNRLIFQFRYFQWQNRIKKKKNIEN